jgi:hypothetical protein
MSGRLFRSVIELPGNYEIVTLPDGTQIQRERQTKAQARIQALKVKARNEQLRQTLMLLSGEVDKSAEFRIPEEITQKDHTAINHLIKESKIISHMNDNPATAYSNETDCVVEPPPSLTPENGSSAIQRQISINTGKKTGRLELLNSNTKHQTRKSEFNLLNLKKLLFG